MSFTNKSSHFRSLIPRLLKFYIFITISYLISQDVSSVFTLGVNGREMHEMQNSYSSIPTHISLPNLTLIKTSNHFFKPRMNCLRNTIHERFLLKLDGASKCLQVHLQERSSHKAQRYPSKLLH